jgi:threonine dehydrogenase-like Zn-dependent dehydrogenase
MTMVLELYRSVPRYAAAKVVGRRVPGLISGPLAPLRHVDRADPELPGEGWGALKPRLSGICGSDLALLSGKSSFYFSPLVSMPFVLGHEVVAELADDLEDLSAGQRVVLDPVLSCAARGEDPKCLSCAVGLTGRCDRVTVGHVSAGLQTGYCNDTGGGWGGRMVAHRSQLYPVPEALDDSRAVLVEPLACALHSVLRARVEAGDSVLVSGAGTVGLLTVLALREFTEAKTITVVAKHPAQKEVAMALGASEVVGTKDAVTALRRATRAMRLKPERGMPFLLGGVDVAFDAVGSSSSLDLVLRTTKAGGRVVLSGIPAIGADLTPVWFRELELVGAYTSGTEQVNGKPRKAFDLAIELASAAPLDKVVGATYPLERWREALDHALAAGKLGIAKVVFQPN